MHDLDISGVQICETLRVPNDKFQYPIEIEDLGIGIDDVKKYDIKPEEVDKNLLILINWQIWQMSIENFSMVVSITDV